LQAYATSSIFGAPSYKVSNPTAAVFVDDNFNVTNSVIITNLLCISTHRLMTETDIRMVRFQDYRTTFYLQQKSFISEKSYEILTNIWLHNLICQQEDYEHSRVV
jgi:predicted deacetylase